MTTEEEQALEQLRGSFRMLLEAPAVFDEAMFDQGYMLLGDNPKSLYHGVALLAGMTSWLIQMTSFLLDRQPDAIRDALVIWATTEDGGDDPGQFLDLIDQQEAAHG